MAVRKGVVAISRRRASERLAESCAVATRVPGGGVIRGLGRSVMASMSSPSRPTEVSPIRTPSAS
ncbi:hypothetical protein D3C86_1067610 [compost metagenome]